jgi:hypothetical protein
MRSSALNWGDSACLYSAERRIFSPFVEARRARIVTRQRAERAQTTTSRTSKMLDSL